MVIGLGENNISRLPHQQNCSLLYHFKDSFLGCRRELATSTADNAKDGSEELLSRCTVFLDRIPLELLRIRNSNTMHLGKNFFDAISCLHYALNFAFPRLQNPELI